jgi:polyhydroxyalkanoate synthesis regulator phasin
MMNAFRFLFCLLLCSLFASAQNRAQFPWWNSPVAADIGLSQAQTVKIRQIVRSYRDKLFDARNEVQKAEAALDELMNDGNMNAEEAKPIINRVAQARANSSHVFLEMSTRIREVLTINQWIQLVQRWDEVRAKKAIEPFTITPQ